MKSAILFSCLSAITAVISTECRYTPARDSSKLSVSIDGSFDDWASFKVGVTNVGGDGNGPFGEDVDITEFDYHNDDAYLYLFFKCKPTIDERYRKKGGTGMFGYFYLDSDSNKQTGATKIDLSGNSAMLGTEVQIVVSIGVFATKEPDKPVQSGCFVSYELKRWNPSSNDFSVRYGTKNLGLMQRLSHMVKMVWRSRSL